MGLLSSMFSRSERRVSAEDPNIPLSDPRLSDLWGGGSSSASGVKVTHRKMLGISTVWQAINLISGDVAKLPFNVYEREGSYRSIAKQHPAQKLIRRKANDAQNAFRFWRQVLVQRLLWNQAFVRIVRSPDGRPVALYQLLADRTMATQIDGEPYIVTEVGRRVRAYHADDVLHLMGVSLDGENAFDLLDAARDHVGKTLAAMKFSSKFFKAGGRVGGILELPMSLQKKARDRLEEGFKKTYENEEAAFKTVILRDNAKFHAAQTTPKDAQLVEIDETDGRRTANYFNLPPHKLGIKGTNTYASVEAENRSYYDGCLSHYLTELAAEANLKLLSLEEQEQDSHFCEHLIAALHWADIQTVAQIGSEGIKNTWMSPNEVRQLFNMGPRSDGQGDAYLQQLNVGTVTENGDVKQPDSARLQKAYDELRADVLQRVSTRLAVHARKQAKRQASFSTWLASEFDAGHREAVRSMVAPLRSLAEACGQEVVDPDQVLTRLKTYLADCLESRSTDDDFAEAVETVLSAWHDSLFAKGSK